MKISSVLKRRTSLPILVVCAAFLFVNMSARAHDAVSAIQIYKSNQDFDTFLGQLKTAIRDEKMGIVAEACADCGARSIGVEIPGNRVVMIFNPHFAVRMLKANVAAGIEAPLRLYVTETDTGSQLSYHKPSEVFAPYFSSGDLAKMARELDFILERIAKSAVQ